MAYPLIRPLLLVALAVVISAALAYAAAATFVPSTATAHQHGCHRAHTCPSDHATYRWRGYLCVKPTSPKRNRSFRKRVRHDGRLYYCKR